MNSDETKTALKYVFLISGIIALILVQFVRDNERDKVRPKTKTDIELWQAYATTNRCKIIERHDAYSDSTSGFGLTSRGSAVLIDGSKSHPAQDVWQCADGVKHHKTARFSEPVATSK
jgi:hypothetical protein